MQVQERQEDYSVVEVEDWTTAISDGLCIARRRSGMNGEMLVELDVNHATTERDARNRNAFLCATDEQVSARIKDGTYMITDLDFWYSGI